MSSVATMVAGIGLVSYSPAKAGIQQIACAASLELGRHGIRSNVIAPGVIRTPILAQALGVDPTRYEEFLDRLDRRLYEVVPLGCAGTPRHIAEAALFLASDRSAYVTGQTLTVDGGLTSTWHPGLGTAVRGVVEEMNSGQSQPEVPPEVRSS